MHLSDCILCIICTIVRYSMQRFLMLHAEQDEFFLCIMRDWVQAVPQIGLFLGYPPEDVEGFIKVFREDPSQMSHLAGDESAFLCFR